MARNGKRLGFLPDWRILTYLILVINLLFLLWIITGVSASNGPCKGLSARVCNDAANTGKGIGVFVIVVFWVIVDIILGVIFLITNRGGKRDCPACGRGVKRGVTVCGSCSYDFVSRAPAQSPAV